MFYELNTYDIYGSNPWKRDDAVSLTGTFKGDTNVWATIVGRLDPEVEFSQEEHIEDADIRSTMANTTEATGVAERDIFGIAIPNLLPDG